jgi:hypothetical protein
MTNIISTWHHLLYFELKPHSNSPEMGKEPIIN